MSVLGRFPGQIFTARGWGLLGTGAVSLLAAQVMGRRDLLTLAILLLVLPLVSLAGTRVFKPRFRVYREFNPSTVETAETTTVRLAIARSGTGSGAGAGFGQVVMEEQLPARFGVSPAFGFPARSAAGGTSRYEYRLRSRQRGQFLIGPVTAEFGDPFGLSRHRQAIGGVDLLTVTPAAVALPATGLAGARGHDGVTATRVRGNPSDDDVMTREYRHGDPMRRVHWPATARHGSLMVRQEEAVTTPEATIILDQRLAAFAPGGTADADGQPGTSDAFEWAVTAAVSVSTHLVERNYTLRCLDSAGEPAFLRSASAPQPEEDEYAGASGLQSVAESLAAVQPAGPQHARREPKGRFRRGSPAAVQAGAQPFEDGLMDKLSAHRLRGPIVAILGRLSLPEAQALSPAAGFGAGAFALLVTDRAEEPGPVLEALQRGGWRAVAVSASTALPAAWSAFDEDDQSYTVSFPAAAEVRRNPGGPR